MSLSSRTAVGLKAGIFGILSNLSAFAIKAAAGVLSGSVTVVADSVNSLTDAGSSILTVIGFRLASKPADREHPYGHARYENVTALAVSMLMLAVGVMFAKNSIEKIISPSPPEIGILTYSALVISVMLKLLQWRYNRVCAKKIDSGALRAAALDSLSDAGITASVLISVIVMKVFKINIDGWTGLLVSIFIIICSARTVRDAVSPMLGQSPPKELIDAVAGIIMSRSPDILGYHDLEIHNYGPGANFGSVHCEVDGSRSIREVHEVIDGVENEIHERLGVVITIHTDPVAVEERCSL